MTIPRKENSTKEIVRKEYKEPERLSWSELVHQSKQQKKFGSAMWAGHIKDYAILTTMRMRLRLQKEPGRPQALLYDKEKDFFYLRYTTVSESNRVRNNPVFLKDLKNNPERLIGIYTDAVNHKDLLSDIWHAISGEDWDELAPV